MDKYQDIIDILASLASLIAITTVLYSWFRSSQKPLVVERIVIHINETESTYILIVKNRKDYPVTIKKIDCYTNKEFHVEKKNNQKPTYTECLNIAHRLFTNTDEFEISACGNTDIRITGIHSADKISKLMFSLNTTHGYHELWCNKISRVEMGKAEVFGVEYINDFESKLKAILKYYLLKAKHIFQIKLW